MARRLFDAIDPDALAARIAPEASAAEREAALAGVKDQAVSVFDSPALRHLLKEVKAASEIRIDAISTDAVVSSGWNEAKAAETVERFRRFLDERKDELTALQILYGLPYAARWLTYEAVEDLRDALRRPPWLLQPLDLWRAYRRLAADRVRGNPAGTLADIVMLVRYALGQIEVLEPLPAVVAGRFNLWLGREERAGRRYSEEQLAWLRAIRDHLAVNLEIAPADLSEAPEFTARGGMVKARSLFGDQLPGLLEDLTGALVA
ncbi:MAG: type I restriction-modification enzyme R subunit C-terminal domain-containing protein [Acetobacteraceae bacterium]